MISRIITQYLSKNKRLVVPDFGAFIRKDGGEIVFMEFLKKDDQVLTSLVSRANNISEEQANLIIAKFISDIKHACSLGSGYVIEGIGTIRASSDGLYHLDYNPSVRAIAPTPAQAQAIPKQEPHKAVSPQSRPQQSIPRQQVVSEPPQQTRQTERQVPPPPQQVAREQRQPHIMEGSERARQQTSPRQRPQQVGYDASQTERYQGDPNQPPRPPRPPHKQKKGADTVMIVAIIAALFAIGSIVFGVLVNVNPKDSMRSTNRLEEIDRKMEEIKGEKDTLSIEQELTTDDINNQ